MANETAIEAAARQVEQDELRVAKQKAVAKELRRLQEQFGVAFLSHARAVQKLKHFEEELANHRAELIRLRAN